MLSVSEAREPLALVVPAYFDPTVSYKRIRQILEAMFRDSEVFCSRERLLAVVDWKTKAEEVLSEAAAGSTLRNWDWRSRHYLLCLLILTHVRNRPILASNQTAA